MKKAVITGASGFLGRNLVGKLKKDGQWQITALTSAWERRRAEEPESPVRYEDPHGIGTGRETAWMKDAVVIHCAYPRARSGEEIALGLAYTKDVFRSCADHGAKALIHISSQSVYSAERKEPARETDPVCIGSIYAAGKYMSELLAEGVFGRTPTAYTNIRLASLIGPGFDVRITNRLLKQALETGKIAVKEQPQLFGFLDVADACAGIRAMLESDPQTWRPVYNLGIRGGYTLDDIVMAIRRVVKEEAHKEIWVKVTPGSDTGNSCVDASLFYSDFGFEPEIALDESLRRMM